MARRIIGAAAYRTRLVLVRPYHLSLATLEAFESVLLRVITEAGEGVGETTDTPGYYSQSLAEAWRLTAAWGPRLIGRSPQEGLAELGAAGVPRSFAATSVFTALEVAAGFPAEGGTVPLVGTIQGETPEALAASVRALQAGGYQTLKFKVGFDVPADLARLRVVQAELAPGVTVRLDANQGYTLEQARLFLDRLEPRGIELLEQPLAPDAWEEMARLARQTPVPLMLDEAIEDEADLQRTIDSGCAQLVKFKLMKCGSLAHLEELIGRARRAGLKVILGNGVASDIGCLHEAAVAHRTGLTDLAGEMNGYLKIHQGFLAPGLATRAGRMLLPAAPAQVRWNRVIASAQEVRVWGQVPDLAAGEERG